ncbi:YopX family protein [Arthrobacter sp. KNU40]|uniref:YopX family protein n=1 Tax=Arthrobacter sp. KNU40 TaxID=3447965 RepID=UPI003F5EEE54
MREIKFRAQTLDGSWVYTSPEVMFNFVGEFAYLPGRGQGASIIPFVKGTIGQLTGVKDKNGAEIYEGDILEHRPSDYDPEERWDRYEVKWHNHGFVAAWERDPELKNKDNDGLNDSHLDIELIGNIHETPELLGARS